MSATTHPLVNFGDAKAFLNRLGWPHCFQTFDDAGHGRSGLLRTIHAEQGTAELFLHLMKLNHSGAGVFVTVNATDGRGRKRENITAVRAQFVDGDGVAMPTTWHREPDLLTARDATHWHAYWLTSTTPLEKFTENQKRLAKHYGTDPAVCDLPRVMRIPGYLHRKGEPTRYDLLKCCEVKA
jgi:hypothetical protein